MDLSLLLLLFEFTVVFKQLGVGILQLGQSVPERAGGRGLGVCVHINSYTKFCVHKLLCLNYIFIKANQSASRVLIFPERLLQINTNQSVSLYMLCVASDLSSSAFLCSIWFWAFMLSSCSFSLSFSD